MTGEALLRSYPGRVNPGAPLTHSIGITESHYGHFLAICIRAASGEYQAAVMTWADALDMARRIIARWEDQPTPGVAPTDTA